VIVASVIQNGMDLKLSEEVGAQGGESHELSVRSLQGGTQQPQEPGCLTLRALRKQLFGLIEAQQ
jgi:hypothetical protein